jgi:hypothetical protein
VDKARRRQQSTPRVWKDLMRSWQMQCSGAVYAGGTGTGTGTQRDAIGLGLPWMVRTINGYHAGALVDAWTVLQLVRPFVLCAGGS